MNNEKQKIVVVTGPTASGKSSLAIDLATYFGGEIVNADSMQVYRGMDVGTAKLSRKAQMGIPHHLLDVVNPDEEFNAAIYRSLSLPQLKGIASREKLGFVVGGTGLYIKALLGGLLDCPQSDPGLREELRQEWEEHGAGFLCERLRLLDPESARKIHPHDQMRIIRALEIIHLTKKPFSSLTRNHNFKNRSFQALKICLQMSREQLYHRINERCINMIEKGLVRETENLLNKGYSSDLKPMKSIGYRHMTGFLAGTWDLDEATCQLQTDTRRYAKRQLTWFRGDPKMHWFEPEDRDGIIRKIAEFI